MRGAPKHNERNAKLIQIYAETGNYATAGRECGISGNRAAYIINRENGTAKQVVKQELPVWLR